MPRTQDTLGVGVVGIGWCAAQHIRAFQRNPRARLVALCGRDERGIVESLERNGVDSGGARITTRYEDLLDSPDIDIISIATPNHLHAAQAVAAARAGKHLLLEKPTGLDEAELVAIRDAVRRADVVTIVSFELRYNPYLRFLHWMRTSGRLGRIRFVRVQYLSRVTDWYAGWNWVRTKASGRSHLLAAGCHAVDALRWLGGLEPRQVSAYHAHFTDGYEWPTTIVANLQLEDGALGHVTSSTDFRLPYTFGIELMGDRATIRDTLIAWGDAPAVDIADLRDANPLPEITLHEATYGSGAPAIRIESRVMPDTADVAHHPFQAEIDDLVTCILERRDTMLNVFDAQKTMEVCLAADRSAASDGASVALPLIAEAGAS